MKTTAANAITIRLKANVLYNLYNTQPATPCPTSTRPPPFILKGRPTPATLSGVMAISKELLEILVCPLCKAALELKQDENGLKCVQCKRVYPIRDDIPVMLVDEARIEE